jgi:erythromycin esterase
MRLLRPSGALAIALAASCAAPGKAAPQSAPPIDYPAAPYDPAGPVVRMKALEWIKANARPFEGDLDRLDELQPLLDRLDNARVIGLGELSHGDRESAVTKIAIAKGLIEHKGVRLIGIESSIGSSIELERFTLDGRAFPTPEAERAEASRVLLAAAVYDIWLSEPFLDFLVWLRRFNLKAEKRVRFANFDGSEPVADARVIVSVIRDSAAGRDRESILKQLSEVEAALAPLLSVASGDAYSDYLPMQTLESVVAHEAQVFALERLFSAVAPEEDKAKDLVIPRLVLAALKDFYATTARRRAGKPIEEAFKDSFSGNTNNSSFRNRVSRRDRDMAQTIVRIFRERQGERYILFAHNSHIERNGFDGLDFASYALSMGRFLQAELEDGYVALNFVTAGGSFTASFTSDRDGSMQVGATIGKIAENPYSLGAYYSRAGYSRFWLDLRDMPGVEPWAVSWRSYPFVTMAPGNTWVPHLLYFPSALPVANGTDITVFFDRVSATKRIDKPRPAR